MYKKIERYDAQRVSRKGRKKMPFSPEDPECLALDLSDLDGINSVARALSVRKRVEILGLLGEKNIMSINEIARALALPVSSASMHVSVLEEAGLVNSERLPGIHGAMKMCSRRRSSVWMTLKPHASPKTGQILQALPLGAYSAAGDIAQVCGIASQTGPIGLYNNPRSFYLPQRLEAQVLWFANGYLDYAFSLPVRRDIEIEAIELSFEVCTQAYIDDPARKSVIKVLLNGVCLGSGLCTLDSQGRRGTLNPPWWPDVATQHGQLQKWRVTREGSHLNGERISDVTLAQTGLEKASCITARILVPDEEGAQGGINLFGEGFGDYSQALNLLIEYKKT